MRFVFALLIAAATLAGCGGGGDGGNAPAGAASVTGLSVTPEQLSFSTTGPNPGMQTVMVAVPSGSPSYERQISYSPSVTEWLQVVPGSGATALPNVPQPLVFNVNAAGLPAGVHSATVRFSLPSSPPVYVTVTLFVGDPRVNFVAPYVVPAGAGGDVIIRGHGFSALSPETLSVQFNSAPATKAAVVSDTEIRATYPSLAAGAYSISVSSGATSIPSRAALKLVVTDPPAFPLHTIPRPASAGRPSNLIYDAERQALLFLDQTNHRMLRYALSGNGDADSDLGNAPLNHIALSPDGTELIRVAGVQLWRLDPVTLAVISSVDSTPSLGFLGYLFMPAFANDGGLIAGGFATGGAWLNRYDMLTQTFTPVSFLPQMVSRPMFASPDGRTLVRPFSLPDPLQLPPNSQETRLYVYDAGTGALTPRAVTTRGPGWSQPFHISMTRDASRIILVNDSPATLITVYDAAFNALGTLPSGANPFVLSPDGNFAYAYSSREGRLRKFNVSTSGVSEVGSGSVIAPANTDMAEMTVTPDGGTLFLVGQTSVVITPAP